MRTLSKQRQSIRGSALVVALLISVIGTFGMAAMIALLGSRAFFVENTELAIKRRIALANSRAMAQEFFLNGAIVGVNTSATVLDLGDDWGKVTIPAFTTSSLASNQEFSLHNRLGPADTAGFTTDVDLTMENAGLTFTYLMQLKSRSPILAGDLLILNRNYLGASGNVDVSGYFKVFGNTQIWDNSTLTLSSFSSTSFSHENAPGVAIATTNAGGASLATTAYPNYFRSSGFVSGTYSVANLNGAFNVLFPSGTSNPPEVVANTLDYKMTSGGGAIPVNGDLPITISGVSSNNGTVVIDLSVHTLSQVRIGSGITKVIFKGQTTALDFTAAGTLPPVTVLINTEPSLVEVAQIDFVGDNNRRLILGVHRKLAASWMTILADRTTSPMGEWRTILSAENTPIAFDVAGGQTLGVIRGGIRTDRPISVASGDGIQLIRETQPDLLERFDTREAWMEIFQR